MFKLWRKFYVLCINIFKILLKYLKFGCKNEVHNSNSYFAKGIDVLFIIKPQFSHQTMAHQNPWLMVKISKSQ